MARRKQLKGISGNLVQWCMSRNFDYEGYWAIGQLYSHAKANETEEVVLNLIKQFVSRDSIETELSSVKLMLLGVIKRELESKQIPQRWLRDVTVVFKFNTEFQHKYHYRGSSLGGLPFICTVRITTDLDKTYSKESGCNVRIHSPLREQRRYDF